MFRKLTDSGAISRIKKTEVRSGRLGRGHRPGGGDTHMDFDDRNRLLYVDRSAACTTGAVSEDGGNTFPLDRKNPLSCIGGGDDPEGATDDRQGVAAFGDGIAYSTVRNPAVAVGSGISMSRTTDAGKT